MNEKVCDKCCYKGRSDICASCVSPDAGYPVCFTPFIADEVDMVNNPAHYQSDGGLEVIDVIEAFTDDLKGPEAVCTGNVLKYVCRWKKKNGLEDLKKARWYLDRLIKKLEKEGEQ